MPPSDQAPLSESGTRNSYRRSPGFNWRGPVFIGIALIMIASALFFKGPDGTAVYKTPAEFLTLLRSDDIVNTPSRPLRIEISGDTDVQYLTGWYKNHVTNDVRRFRAPFPPEWRKPIIDALAKKGDMQPLPRPTSDVIVSKLTEFLPIGLFVLILFSFFRRARRR
jgi:hypothetical protein